MPSERHSYVNILLLIELGFFLNGYSPIFLSGKYRSLPATQTETLWFIVTLHRQSGHVTSVFDQQLGMDTYQ